MKELFDPGIYDLYERTTYSVRGRDGLEIFFTIRDALNVPGIKGLVFAIITAWNPMNEKLGLDENRRRNEELQRHLRRTDYVFYPSRGVLGDHCEESFTVENMPESEALRLGSLFEQYAVVVQDAVGCRLIRCPPQGL